MAYNTKIIWLQQQLAALEDLFDLSDESELMRISLRNRIKNLKEEIENENQEDVYSDASICLWFSGDATFGSMGIKGSFMKETLGSIEGMVKSASSARIRKWEIGNHKKARRPSGDFFVTSLTNGSYGYKISYEEDGMLFSDSIIKDSINDVIDVIEETAASGLDIDKLIQKYPLRLLSNLKDLYTSIKKADSFLKIESGNKGILLSKSQTVLGYENICTQDISEKEDVIEGVFKGALLESGKFEFVDDKGKKLHGNISEDMDSEVMTDMVKRFTNCRCRINVIRHLSSYSNGNKREQLELLSIDEV